MISDYYNDSNSSSPDSEPPVPMPTEAYAFGGGKDLLIFATALVQSEPPDISDLADAVSPAGEFIPRVDERVVIERWLEQGKDDKVWFDTRTYLITDVDQTSGRLWMRDEDAGGSAMSNFKTAPKDRYTFKIPPKRGTPVAEEVQNMKKTSRRQRTSKRVAGSSPSKSKVVTLKKGVKLEKPRKVYNECGGHLVLFKGQRYFTGKSDLDTTKGLIVLPNVGTMSVVVQDPHTGDKEIWKGLDKSEYNAMKKK